MHVDVLVVTALTKERDAILAILHLLTENNCNKGEIEAVGGSAKIGGNQLEVTYRKEIPGHGLNDYHIFDVLPPGSTQTLTVAIAPHLGKGPLDAALSCARIFMDVVPTIVVLLGIAGYMRDEPDDVLGDVGVCTNSYDIAAGKFENGEITGDWRPRVCDDGLVKTIQYKLGHRCEVYDSLEDAAEFKVLNATEVDAEVARTTPKKETFRIHYGTFLSSPFVLADRNYKRALIEKTKDRSLIGIEMEASGVFSAAMAHGISKFLMIKSFSDFAGDDKRTGNPNKDAFQNLCSVRAGWVFVKILEKIGLNLVRTSSGFDDTSYMQKKVRQEVVCYSESIQNSPPFWKDYLKAMSGAFLLEVGSLRDAILQDRAFFKNIDPGREFFARANVLYRHAQSLVAVSVDTVSRYWIDIGTRQFARDLISSQCKESTRLFVFSSPESAHDHGSFLDFHAEKFSNTFLCSVEHYRTLLQQFASGPNSVENLVRRDFALIDYGASHKYFAELSSDRIKLTKVPNETDRNETPARLLRIAGELQRLPHPTIDPLSNNRDLVLPSVDGVPIWKWNRDVWANRKSQSETGVTWKAVLKRLFESDTADVFHLFGFHPTNASCFPKFREQLVRMKLAIQKSASILGAGASGIHSIRLARRHSAPISRQLHDEKLGVNLPYDGRENASYFVLIHFENAEFMRRWLESKRHSEIRMELIRELVNTCEHLSAQSSDVERHKIQLQELLKSVENGHEQKQDAYNKLEKMLGFWRVDLRDDEMLEELVICDPISFS